MGVSYLQLFDLRPFNPLKSSPEYKSPFFLGHPVHITIIAKKKKLLKNLHYSKHQYSKGLGRKGEDQMKIFQLFLILNEAFTNHIPLCNIHTYFFYNRVAHCCLSPVLPQLTRLPPVPLSYWLLVLGRTLLPSTTNTWLANYQLIFLVLTWTRLLSLALTATDVENWPLIGQNNKWSNLTRGNNLDEIKMIKSIIYFRLVLTVIGHQ